MDTDISSYEKPIQRTASGLGIYQFRADFYRHKVQIVLLITKMACVIAAQLLKLCDDIVECHFLFLETCQFSVAIFREC